MKQTQENLQNLLLLLNSRVERLNREYSLKAPKVIIDAELRLIRDVCKKLSKLKIN